MDKSKFKRRFPDRFSQLDPQWAGITLGTTPFTIGRVGCKTVCQTIGHNKMNPEKWMTPGQMAKLLKYTKNGLMYHQQEYPGMKFIKRAWRWSKTRELIEAVNSYDHFAIIAVNGNSHFVFAFYFTSKGLMIIDPWDGKCKLLERNYRPCGYEIIVKV